MVKKLAESGQDAHGFTCANMFHIEMVEGLQTPRLRTDVYRRGSQEFVISIWQVPAHWTPEQAAEFALSPDMLAAVKKVKDDYGKDITRVDAKSVTFLWLFQGTPFTLALRTGLGIDHCELLFERFAGVYTVMNGYMKDLAERAVTENVLEMDNGVKIAFSEGYNGIRRYVELPVEPWQDEYRGNYRAYYGAYKEWKRQMRRAQRALCNLPMQGGNALITCEALLKIIEEGGRLGVYPKMAVYDEIIVEAPDSVRPIILKGILERAMLGSARKYMAYVQPGAEADIKKAGKTWVKS